MDFTNGKGAETSSKFNIAGRTVLTGKPADVAAFATFVGVPVGLFSAATYFFPYGTALAVAGAATGGSLAVGRHEDHKADGTVSVRPMHAPLWAKAGASLLLAALLFKSPTQAELVSNSIVAGGSGLVTYGMGRNFLWTTHASKAIK